MRQLEHLLQRKVALECEKRSLDDPRYSMFVAFPFQGKRSPKFMQQLIAEGFKKGFPDCALLCPCFRRCRMVNAGLFIEHKIKPGKTTKEQEAWLIRLNTWGYVAEISYSFEQSIAFIENQLKYE